MVVSPNIHLYMVVWGSRWINPIFTCPFCKKSQQEKCHYRSEFNGFFQRFFFCFWAHPLVAVLKNPPKKRYGRNGKLLGRSACEDVGSDDLTCWLCQNTWGFHHCGHSTFEKWIRMKSLICFKKGIPGYISWQIRKNPSRLYSMIPILIPQKKLTWNLHRT